MSQEKVEEIVKEFLPKLKGLTESDISQVLNLIRYSVRYSPINVEFVPKDWDGEEKFSANN